MRHLRHLGRGQCHSSAGKPLAARKRRMAGSVLLLLAMLAVSACNGPSSYKNALVVHVVAPSCESTNQTSPLLTVEKVVGGWGKTTVTEWHSMTRLDECGEPFDGHDWNGSVLQVWRSDFDWRARQQVQLQLGNQVDNPNRWAIGQDVQLRIDWDHVFLGSVDIGDNGSVEFVAGRDVETAVSEVETRQGCEPGPPRNGPDCLPDEWEHADLFTFEAVAAVVEVSEDTTSTPTTSR